MLCMNFRLGDRIRVTVEKANYISQKAGHPCHKVCGFYIYILHRVTHRMWSYESESAHILLFKILSLISRIKKKLCIHQECEVFLYQMGHS